MATYFINRVKYGSGVQSIDQEPTLDDALETSIEEPEETGSDYEETLKAYEMELLSRDIDFEISDRSEYSSQLEECDIATDDLFSGCEKGLNAIKLLEDAEESGVYSELLAGMESYYKFHVYCVEKLKLDTKGPGLESIINTPLSSIEPGLENIRSAIDSIFNAIGNIIKWLLDKIQIWIRKIVRMCSGFGKKAKTFKKNLQHFRKTHPNVSKLSEKNSREFVEFLVKRYKGINRLTSPHVSKTPGVSGLGTTMVNLLDKEINLVYPSIDTLPLGKDTEFLRGLVGFYRGKDILNCKKAIKDSPEFGKLVAATQKVVADNDKVVSKIFSVDYEYAWYLIVGGSEVSNFKPMIGKVALSKVEMVVDDIKAEDGNKIFNDKPVEWLDKTLDYIISNYDKIMKRPENMIKEISRTRADLNKAYSKYKTNKSNKDVAACLTMYMQFAKKLVTKYQEGAVKSAISSMKQLMDVCSRLYSDIIGSGSSEEADKWDQRGQKTAQDIKDADAQGKERKPGFFNNMFKSQKQANHDLRYGNGDENDHGIKKSNGGGFFNKRDFN